MKTVRFSQVVEQSGKPEVYLLLVDPKKDADFQRALKANRVMTLQHGSGGKTDYGTVGYTAGAQSQVLLFPRALQLPENARIVAIRYDLLQEEPEAEVFKLESETVPAKTPKPERKAKPSKAPKPVLKVAAPAPKKAKSSSQENVVPFPEPEPEETDDALEELKAGVRAALKALETGNQVAAYNILKRLVE